MPQTLNDHLAAIVEQARFAPSVHNTQPWLIRLDSPDRLEIRLDRRHVLKDGDPTGRQTVISLGILIEALAIAAGQEGFKLVEASYDGSGTASLDFTPAKPIDNSEYLSLLRRRSSDRSLYRPVTLDERLPRRLRELPDADGIDIQVVTDPPLLEKIADLTSKGIAVALSSPGFRQELSRYLSLPWPAKKRGIAVRSLYIPLWIALLEPALLRLGVNLKAESRLEKRRWLSASGVVLILGDGDMPRYWLEAGRTYLRASLEVEKAGLSQATSAAVVEASNYHEDIEEALGTSKRVLALIRIGAGSSRRHYSPRVPADELITSN